MKKASSTHKSMGKKGYASTGLDSGLSETAKVGKTAPEEVSGSQRPKPQRHGSIATK